MSFNAIPILTTSINSDTSATPTTLVQRDADGGILGNVVTGSTLETTGNFMGNASSQTTSFTAGAATDYFVSASGGAVTVTLPPASSNQGVVYHVWKTDSSGNAVTLTGVLGVGTISTQYHQVRVVSDGSNWYGA